MENGRTTGGSTAEHATTRRIEGLDGLRAIAAVAVLLYHFLPSLAPGGLLGVDVFFVLSGFLITALLLGEHERLGRIRLGRFWLRRFRRLFPAVATAVLTTTAAAYFVSPDLLVGIRRQVIGSLTFTANWVDIASGQSYFAAANPPLLRNMWSLAIEQQFYVIWPLIVLAIIAVIPEKRRWIAPAGLAIAASATMFALQRAGADPTRIYEGTFSHSMGLMAGATLAMLSAGVLTRARPRLGVITRFNRGMLGWLGFAGIIILFFTLTKNPAFIYPWAFIAASIATFAILQALLPEVTSGFGPAAVMRALLSWRPLTWLGERSYSLYLWHWPIFLLVSNYPGLNPWLNAAICAALSLVCAALSYRYVETPMRLRGIWPTLKSGLRRLVMPASRGGATNATARAGLALATALALVIPSLAGIALADPPTKTIAELNVERGQKLLAERERKRKAEAERKAREYAAKFPPPQSNDAVVVVGDSVTVAAGGELGEALPGAIIDAAVSRSSLVGAEIVRDMKTRGALRPYLVFALATNSDMPEAKVKELLQIVGPDVRVVFVTGFGPPVDDWIFRTNATLRAIAPKYPLQVRIADWEKAIAPRQDLLASDQVHPGPAGAELYTKTIVDALNSFPIVK